MNQGGTEPRRESPAGAPGIGAEERRCRLADWLATPAGGRLLALERPAVQESVRRFLGDSLLWMGATADLVDTTAQCMVRARIVCTTYGTSGRGRPSPRGSERADIADANLVAADTAELPFAATSIDGVVLHHALDVVADQRGTLREAARVLKPGGRLVVVGFNPLSLWSLSKPLPAFRALRPLSIPRLVDWLTVLGMTRDARTVYLNYRSALPVAFAGDRWQTASAWVNQLQAPLGGAYVLAAAKRGPGYIVQRRSQRKDGRELAPAILPNAS